MHEMRNRTLALLTVLTVAACSGDNGATGPQGEQGPTGANGATGATGPAGQDLTAGAKPESCAVCHAGAGTEHQALYNSWADGLSTTTTKLGATIVSVATSAGTNAGSFKATVTFRLTKNGQPYVDAGTVAGKALPTLKQKTMYFVSYDGAGKFPTAPYNQDASADPTGTVGGQVATSPVNFSFGSPTLTDAATGTYTMIKDNLTADPLLANANAFVYGYFGDTVLSIPVKQGTHYTLMDNVISVSSVLQGTVGYTSTATVTGCEKCHQKPYSKHGYRQATVAGLNDFVSCKACHTDSRRGTDGAWYLLADDPAAFVAQGCSEPGAESVECLTAAQLTKYAYTANLMNDTHNSHAFEFEYPQSMANCVTCHEGKLDRILTDANFTMTTCKSCHPVTGTNGDPKRAPPLKTIMPSAIHGSDLYAFGLDCAMCHKAGGAKTFSQIHTGYDKAIYADNAGARYASSIKAQIDSATFDSATKKLTVNFSATGTGSASIKPTVVISLYGYDTKDFLVSGHGSQADGKRNLEWADGSTSNSPRLTVVAGASASAWVATADLTTWASQLADGSIKRAEIGILPARGLDPAKAIQTDAAKANYNPQIAITGQTRTFDLVARALVADSASYGKTIVSAAKCNTCHDALATTFHNPNYGSAGVVGCRLCHVGLSGGSHLEMQSRSIDSYVHAIHSFQAFDVGGIDFADPVASLRYEHTIEATYPNFTILNCESCHNSGTYDVPDQSRSMPGLLSAASTLKNKDRAIGAVPSYVTGPASRACGSCHRAEMINEDKAGELAAFNQHTADNGFMLTNGTGVLDAAIAKIMALFK